MVPSAGQGPDAARGKPERGRSAVDGPTVVGPKEDPTFHTVGPGKEAGAAGGAQSGPDGPSPGAADREEPPISDVFFAAARRLTAHLLDLRTDALRLIKARRDRVQVRARAIAFQVAMLGVLAIFGVVTLAVAAWLMLVGLAGALNALFGTAPWVGSLIVGVAVPLLTLLGIYLVRRSAEKSQLRRLMEEYRDLERRRDLERGAFGRPDAPSAADPAAKHPRREHAARPAAEEVRP